MRRVATQAPQNYLIPKLRLKLKPMTLRVPCSLIDQLNNVRVRAEQAGLVLDLQSAVTEALERAAREAEEALDRLERTGQSPENRDLEPKAKGRAVA